VKWKVPARQKLIHFLQSCLDPSPSGKVLRKALEANLCRVNGKVERFGSAEVEKGALVELSDEWDALPSENILSLPILYEDEFLLIVNKPAGWVCTDENCQKAFGAHSMLVHRLDKETTGLLLIAKTKQARSAMIELFKTHQIEKLYFAVVDGVPSKDQGVQESFLTKVGTFEGQTRYGSRSTGQFAKTYWKVLAKGKQAALLACQPVTGRTHQIRVHLAELGHPILVDRQYASRFKCSYFAKRPLLHAARLKFKHPLIDKVVDVEQKPPADFQQAVKELISGG
jgi:RluA family pseudouridine synthase